MPPKRKATCKISSNGSKKTCNPPPKVCCPNVAKVPKLIVKGGVEVLSIVTGEDSVTEIELYLNPRMGVNAADLDHYSNWYTYSYDMQPTSEVVPPENLPSYSCARVALPMLNEDITCDTLQMWEAVSVKTEVVGISSLTNVHYQDMMRVHDKGGGR